jgi:SpoVK/Ycf46/Vps4 family AAA+-type ATPase
MLDKIESNGWIGALFLGPGGSGKSYFSTALAGEFNIKAITLDTGAMKSSGVGDSERNIRSAFKTIEAIGQDRVLICATCNGLQELKPELQRRLASAGMWFFDLPDDREKQVIWKLQIDKFGLDKKQALPNDKGWSSSDIRDCCRTAYLLGETLTEASLRVNKAMAREPERIENLRKLANGRLSSASYLGPYRMQMETMSSTRKIGE